ncbi:MAG: hypothetical protein WC763_06640 [Candidatus Paceibacterota bacterium]|jgi:hypothetical protein
MDITTATPTAPAVTSNNELKGDALVAEAEKKMSGGVGNEKDTAIADELYEAAAVHYKLAELHEAAAVYYKLCNKLPLLEWLRKFHPTLVQDYVESEEESVEARLSITRADLDDLNDGLPVADQFHLY